MFLGESCEGNHKIVCVKVLESIVLPYQIFLNVSNFKCFWEGCEGNHKIVCVESQHKSKVTQKKFISTLVYINFRGVVVGGGKGANSKLVFTTVYLLTSLNIALDVLLLH